jgi:hypothetical protein
MVQLVDRDVNILASINRFGFLFGRQIKLLMGFHVNGKASSRRIKKLVDGGYILRKYLLVGKPSILSLSKEGFELIKIKEDGTKRKRYNKSISLSTIKHEYSVVDAMIYLADRESVKYEDFMTEHEILINKGNSSEHYLQKREDRVHLPDLVFKKAEHEEVCVEVELTVKDIDIFRKNVESNSERYFKQIWIVKKSHKKTRDRLGAYGDVEIIDYEEIDGWVNRKE